MVIQVDQEGMKVIKQLCDIALKSAGIQNFNAVSRILGSVRMLPTPEEIRTGVNQSPLDVKEQSRPKSSKKEDEESDQAVAEKQEKKEKEEVAEGKEVEKE